MLSIMEVVMALKRTPLFGTVHGEGLKRLADAVREKRMNAGELIFAEQDLGEEMYLVGSGAVLLYHAIAGREEPIALVRAGDYFGEMAIIDELPRSTSARTEEDSILLVLHKTEFRAAVQDYPDIAFEILKEFCRRLRKADLSIRSLNEELGGRRIEAK